MLQRGLSPGAISNVQALLAPLIIRELEKTLVFADYRLWQHTQAALKNKLIRLLARLVSRLGLPKRHSNEFHQVN